MPISMLVEQVSHREIGSNDENAAFSYRENVPDRLRVPPFWGCRGTAIHSSAVETAFVGVPKEDLI